MGEGDGSYCSLLYCGRLLLDVCRGEGGRIALGYIVDDYCLTFFRGRGMVRIALGYIVDDYCLTFV